MEYIKILNQLLNHLLTNIAMLESKPGTYSEELALLNRKRLELEEEIDAWMDMESKYVQIDPSDIDKKASAMDNMVDHTIPPYFLP